jgi:hypothetical protein
MSQPSSSAVSELLDALDSEGGKDIPALMEWAAGALALIYPGPATGYVLSLRQRAGRVRLAMLKARGESQS